MRKEDRLAIYEKFFHQINVYCITMNQEKIKDAVSLINSWSYAHRIGNGEHSEYQQKKIVENVIKKMDEFS